jgi:fluoride ion exporter CrcB/FEX
MVTLFLTTELMDGLSTYRSLVWDTDQMLAIPAERLPTVLYLVLSMVLGFMLVRLGLRFGEGLMQSHLFAARRS